MPGLVVVDDGALLGARRGSDLEVHHAAVAHGDLVERRVGQVQVCAVPAAPPLVAARAQCRASHSPRANFNAMHLRGNPPQAD